MKALAFWTVLVVFVATTASLSVAHFTPASSALKQFVKPGPLSPGHASLANQCAACHVPNVGVTVAKCTACHADNERLLGRQPTAFHASVTECATCHVEHQNTNIRPITLDHVELAKVGARSLVRASRTDGASAATVASIETWLRRRIPGELDTDSAREVLNCTTCHATKDRHLGLFGTDCAQCHTFSKWTVAEFQHPSPRSTSCAQCHQSPPSHRMMHFDMVSKKIARQEDSAVAECCGAVQVNQCYRCHQTTSWNDIRGVGYFKMH